MAGTRTERVGVARWALAGAGLLLLALVLRLATGRAEAPGEGDARAAGRDEAALALPSPAEASSSPLAAPDAGSRRAAAPSDESEPRADERCLRVSVTSRRSFARDAEPVPRVAFEIALGDAWKSSELVARGETDDGGHAELDLPWHAAEAARGRDLESAVLARTVQPGILRQVIRKTLPAEPSVVEIVLPCRSGATLDGRVVDERGRDWYGRVRAFERPRGGWGSLAEVDTDGRFELSLFHEGEFDLLAETPAGTGAIRGLRVRIDAHPEPIEIVVRGEGELRGIVLDARGEPAAGVDLLLLAHELDGEHGRFLEGTDAAQRLLLEGRGLVLHTLRTARAGTFEVGGLRPGLYEVRAKGSEEERYTRLLTEAPVPSDGRRFTLRFARPHLAVRLVDERGRPWPEPALRCESVSSGDVPDRWSSGCVLVARTRASALARADLDAEAPFLAGKEVEEEVHFDVEPGTYRVGYFSWTQPWEPVEATVGPDDERVEVVLVAREERASAALLLSVSAPDATPLAGDFRVRVESVDGLPLLLRRIGEEEHLPLRIELPAGRHRVVVDAAPRIEDHHGSVVEPRAFGRFATVVNLLPGEERALNARLSEGARLRLEVDGEAREEDARALRARFEDPNLPVDRLAREASILLVPELGWPERAWFSDVPGSAWGDEVCSLPLGSQALSEILPAGRFRLEARMPGGRVASREIELVDGKTTEVALVFE